MAFSEYKIPKNYVWQTAGDLIQKTAFYEHVLTDGPVINVSTLKGIIEIDRMEINLPAPERSFENPVQIWINNPDLILNTANRDKVYVQLTPYYKPFGDDYAIPYIISNGFVAPNGLGVLVYNASPNPAGTNQWEGAFYLYYEIYTIE